jgi:pimeloyl-ACP methyl ester carboxylesterase
VSTPTLFCLHALGSSRLEFGPLAEALGDDFDVVGLDLPGFGDLATPEGTALGTTLDEMTDSVVRAIRRHHATTWMLVGHSMGATVASLVAARTLDGTSGLFGLRGIVQLAGSPPGPEPMDESRRADMISWVEDDAAAAPGLSDGTGQPHRISAEHAREFVDANVGSPLPAELDALMLADVQRANPEAWLAWLRRGSLEDHRADVGVLDLPAAIVAGGADGDLGPDAQRDLHSPVFPRADVTVLDGAGHLLPLERTGEVADIIRTLWSGHAGRGPVIPDDVARTIGSGRTSSQTRAILARRALADEPHHEPRTLTAEQLATLRVIADRVVPQGEAPERTIDIAARVDSQLARGHSDGWRNAALPPDPDAYRLALDALADFATLSESEQDTRIQALIDGEFDAAPTLSAEAMSLWFEDCRVDLVRTWLAHPATMARIGFDGYANGGDVVRIQGFHLLGAGQREAWEPEMPARTFAGTAFTPTGATTPSGADQ